jgi:hypothetical protein
MAALPARPIESPLPPKRDEELKRMEAEMRTLFGLPPKWTLDDDLLPKPKRTSEKQASSRP